jgi:hypothetical protein
MALARWKDLCMDAGDAPAQAAFWGPLLGREFMERDDGDAGLSGATPEERIWIDRVPEPKTVKNRVHIDLVLPTYEPLVAAGARVLDDPEWTTNDWTVLADPEGNELCVFPERPGEPSALVVDAIDQVAMAAWWADVLGVRPAAAPEGIPRWIVDVPGLPFDVWKFVAVPEPKTVKNRWHWDVVCDDVDGLVARGATVLRAPDDEIDWTVLADPEGNEFCAFGS